VVLARSAVYLSNCKFAEKADGKMAVRERILKIFQQAGTPETAPEQYR
jgi:hypothetical protein